MVLPGRRLRRIGSLRASGGAGRRIGRSRGASDSTIHMDGSDRYVGVSGVVRRRSLVRLFFTMCSHGGLAVSDAIVLAPGDRFAAADGRCFLRERIRGTILDFEEHASAATVRQNYPIDANRIALECEVTSYAVAGPAVLQRRGDAFAHGLHPALRLFPRFQRLATIPHAGTSSMEHLGHPRALRRARAPLGPPAGRRKRHGEERRGQKGWQATWHDGRAPYHGAAQPQPKQSRG